MNPIDYSFWCQCSSLPSHKLKIGHLDGFLLVSIHSYPVTWHKRIWQIAQLLLGRDAVHPAVYLDVCQVMILRDALDLALCTEK
jgi:hypothetical protein